MRTGPEKLLEDYGADVVLIRHLSRIRRLCGFTGSNALLLMRRQGWHLLTDRRYAVQAPAEVHGARVVIGEGKFRAAVREASLLGTGDRVLFDSDQWSVARLNAWQVAFPAACWVPGRNLLRDFMARKTGEELRRMRRAQQISEAALEQVLSSIQPGMTEQTVAAELVYAHLRRGAERMSFDPVVASGPRSALPHARPTSRRIREHEVVLLDIGCVYQGYASDMTRVIAMGEPGKRVRQVYEVVLEAQRQALAAARAGMPASALDGAARRVIAQAGFGSAFTHSLGHGIGLEVHEWPRVSERSSELLPGGATITIEPGIYLPGEFGIRIEDSVVLHERGCERLGSLSRALRVIESVDSQPSRA